MKKMLCLLLAVVLAAGLLACSGEPTVGKKKGLHAGFGQADITPELGVPLGGGPEGRFADGVNDALLVSCLAFQEGEDVLLLYSFDAVHSLQNWTDELRARVSIATGVKAESIMVTATNTHAAPELNHGGENVAQVYRDK